MSHLTFQCITDYWGTCYNLPLAFLPYFLNSCREVSCMFVTLCKERSITTTKCNGHLTFQCVIDYWGAHSDTGMHGTIVSFKIAATHGFSSHNCVTK